MKFQPSALSNPEPTPWVVEAGQATAAALPGVIDVTTGLLSKDKKGKKQVEETMVVEDEPAYEVWPFLLTGIAAAGVIGAVWYFWPREED
jgi:hypothetical protein